MGTSNLLLFFSLVSLCAMAASKVVLIGNNITLSFDDIEANFAPTVKGSGEYGILYLAEPLDACTELTNKVEQLPNASSPFALVVRGGCSFEEKVRRAQKAGFKAVIVYDNEDGGILVAMAGNSAGIKIHAVFVSKASGEILSKYAGLTNVEIWLIPTFENSAWSIMAISFISLLAMSAVLATCFFVRRHRIRRERPRAPLVREFHGMSSRLVKAMPSLIFTAVLHSIMSPAWLLLLTQSLLVAVTTSEAKNNVPAVIVFGDSSVDSGNNNVIATVLKSNFKPYGRDFEGGRPTGRFCNGRVPPDFIAEAFGIKRTVPAYLDPAYTIQDFATGVCFASAGTGYDNATSAVLNVIPLWKELEYYKEYQAKLRTHLGVEKANKIISEALYLMSLGTNDFLENYYVFPTRRLHFTVSQYQDFLLRIAENFVRELYALGVRKLSITGLVPVGCLPLERATNILGDHGCNQEYNDVALSFNRKLENVITKLNRELPRLKALSANAYSIVNDIITKPSTYGFEVVEKACCSTGTFEMSYLCSDKNPLTCTDAEKYVFWDAFHPTEKTNRIVSSYLIPKLLETFR